MSKAVVPVTVDDKGKIRYDALLRQGERNDKVLAALATRVCPGGTPCCGARPGHAQALPVCRLSMRATIPLPLWM
jgi:hypothetical protein